MTGHRSGVAKTEVDVVDAVDIDEPRTRRVRNVDRERARPATHPWHRHPSKEVAPPGLGQLGRARMHLHEPVFLESHQVGKSLP